MKKYFFVFHRWLLSVDDDDALSCHFVQPCHAVHLWMMVDSSADSLSDFCLAKKEMETCQIEDCET